MKVWGWILALLGFAWLLVAALLPVTVEVPLELSRGLGSDGVLNLTKLAFKQTNLHVASTLLVVGILMAGFGTVVEALGRQDPADSAPDQKT